MYYDLNPPEYQDDNPIFAIYKLIENVEKKNMCHVTENLQNSLLASEALPDKTFVK